MIAKKRNEAVVDGWRILHFTSNQVHSGDAINLFKRLIKALEEKVA